MLRSLKLQKKIVAIWSLFSLLLNMAQPAFVALTLAPIIAPPNVQAEDATDSATVDPTPTPTVEPSVEPSAEPSTSPVESIAPSADPSTEPSVTPDPSPDATIEPVASVEPSADPSVTPNPAPTDTPTNPEPGQDSSPAPPSESPSLYIESDSSREMTPDAKQSGSPAPNLNEQLNISIVDNTAAESIAEFDLTVTETGSATLATDKADYAPTDTAIITGSGFLANTTYRLTVSSSDEPATSTTVDVTTDDSGDLFYAYQLDGLYRPNYLVEAYLGSTLVATVTFTDGPGNPSADLDQYANDAPEEWVNGNLGASKATYYEGDSVPYRMRFDNLTLASHTVTFEWDTTKSSKHAEDYLTTYNRSVASADPCEDVVSCGAPTTFPIPIDPQVSGAGVTQIPGLFTIFGGTITAASVYSYANGAGFVGDKSARITLTFTASQANPVLAWGGHIAHRQDWGPTNSAISIPGSPYHMRLIDLDGSGGNQDRSLSADAVIFPASITIIKQATPEGSTSFSYTASPSPLSNFALVDDGTTANTLLFSNITNFQTYSVTETVPAAWTLNSIVCGVTSANGGSQTATLPGVEIDLEEGENVTCTFTNEQQAAHLIVIKHVINDGGGASIASDFTMTINGVTATGGNSFPGAEAPGTDKVVSPGSYSVSESGPAGYTASYSTDCTGTISAGQTKTCTVTNDDQQSYIIVDKTVVNDNGGTAAPNDFLLTVDNNAVSDGVAYAVNPGTHTAGETLLSGYTAGSWGGDCDTNASVTVALGQTKTCTITNNDIAPSLTLVKTVTNNNGGSAVATDWTLTATGPTSISGAGGTTSDATFDAGTYALSESVGPTGYAAGPWSCVGGTQDGSNITLGVGQSATCTINNDDISPQLTVIKHVINDNGGNKVAADFTLNVAGSNVSDASFPGAESPGTTVTLNAGAYSVDEDGLAGYAKSLSADCVGTIAVGQTKTCTITNDDIAPTLTLVKTVINNNGGDLQVSQVPLFISGSPAVSGTAYNVSANTLYTASETQQTGYLASAWGGDCASNGTITLLPGDNKTCTITNDDIAPVLTFIKVVNNDYGGTLGEFDFPLYINGNLVTSGVANTLSANTLYILTELQQYGYTGGTISGDCAEDGTITLSPGDTKTCYITNNDVQPRLTVTKVVNNDNGGTKEVSDFPLFVDATGVTSGVQNGFDAGTYIVSETDLPGYTATISGDCNPATGSVTLAVGDVKACTITNDDQPGTLIVEKIVINDDGGNATADDFSYQINGDTAVPFEADGSNSQIVNSGYYTITEPAVSGYTTSYNNCSEVFVPNGGSATCIITNDDQQAYITVVKSVVNDNGGNANPDEFALTLESNSVLSGVAVPVNPGTHTAAETLLPGYTFTGFSGDCDSSGDITVALGESKTCTLTNDDQQAFITVIKVVTNDNGGSADSDDFNLTLEGNPVISGVTVPVNPGTYTADETLLSGYTFEGFSGDCDSSGDITVALGESKTCTLTNNDQQSFIIVDKTVVNNNGGSANPDDFNLTVDNNAVFDEIPYPVNPGFHIVGETLLPGYVAGEWGTDCDVRGGVTVALGETKTCTITNDDQQAYITVVKAVVNDNGGNANPDDFALTLEGNSVLSGVATPVNPGIYTAGETLVDGYTFEGYSEDCDENGDVTVSLGESRTCTLTNDDIAPTITLIKSVEGGSASVDSFGLTIGATSVTSGQTLTVDANTAYSLNEAGLTGYSFTSLTGDAKCPEVLGGTVTLDEDEDITCTITNTRDTGTIIIHKIIDPDGIIEGEGATDDQFPGENWTVDVDGDSEDTSNPASQPTNNVGSSTFSNLKTGTYNALETQQPGYELIDAYCDNENGSPDGETIYSIDLGKDETVNCTFINSPNGVLHGRKWNDADGQGDFDELELLSGWTVNLYKDDGEGYDFVDSFVTDDDAHFGWYWFEHLFPGDYKICEVGQAGYQQTYPTINDGCYLVSLPSGTSSPSVNQEVLNFVAGPAYDFGNAPLTDIHGYKWDDVNGNAEQDEEELLGGWTIFLDENGNETLDEGEESTTTDNDPESPHYGWYQFYDLFPGEYTICEVQQDGWQQTYPLGRETVCHHIVVPNDNEQTENGTVGPEYHFGNQAEPVLRIQKSNDAAGNKNPGDIVTYTLVIDLTGSSLSDVFVTDVTPDGFDYVAGSWTADLNGSPLVVTEPDYASPGTWLLGDMVDGDVITLTYQAQIASDQDGGTYNDIAWAEGSSKGWGTVLALGHDSEYVDDIFVGTDVGINKVTTQTGSVDIEGEVLGTSTELPATGPNTNWLYLALSLLITGLALILGGRRMQKLIIALSVTVALWHGVTTSALAAAPNLSVRVEQPQSPTRLNEWKLSYAVLDRLARTPSVACYVKKPGSGSFVQFDVTKVSSKPTGDNGSCQVNSSVISSGQGTYEFYVTASATGPDESRNSTTVSVIYDTEGPDRPVSYAKEHPWACRYTIKFKTADDGGKTAWVEVFGSKSTSFNTDNGTRIGSVGIGSNQEGSLNHDLVGDDCNQTWYYVIRAFDSSGNQSAHLGDEVVTVTSGSPAPTTAALVVTAAGRGGSVLGSDQADGDEGEVLGEAGDGEEQVESTEGDGLVAGATRAAESLAKNKSFWWIVLVIIALRIVYGILRKPTKN